MEIKAAERRALWQGLASHPAPQDLTGGGPHAVVAWIVVVVDERNGDGLWWRSVS